MADFEGMWRDLAPIGRSATSGGYFRQPWTAAELELRAWFREAADSRGLVVQEDGFGNLVAWWDPVVEEAARGPVVEEAARGPVVEEAARGPVVEEAARGPVVEEAARGPVVEEAARGRLETPAAPTGTLGSASPRLETPAAPSGTPGSASPRLETVAGRPPRRPEDGTGRPPRRPAVLTGSHLDSVIDGGAFDGPLGVVSAFAAIDLLRGRGVVPTRRLGVAAFAEEEGSRFGRACLGSRLAVGATSWDDARGLSDRDGVRLGDVVAGPDASAPSLLTGVDTYVELHVEQGRGLVHHDAPVGVGSAIWPHGRWRYDLTGRADHAGTTRMEDRADPMLTYAMTALAANKQARLSGQRATFGRIEVAPNGTNAVPSRVTAWLDARADSDAALAELVAAVERQAGDRAQRDGTTVTVTAESVTGDVTFDAALRDRLTAALGGVPVLPTQAGHDAGILQAAGIASGMLYVRNPTGVSHSPDERASTADCLAGVAALADALAALVA